MENDRDFAPVELLSVVAIIVIVVGTAFDRRVIHPGSQLPRTSLLPFATYLGGVNIDDCDGITSDSSGNIYLACHSNSSDFPGVTEPKPADDQLHAHVCKIDPRVGRVLYCTQIGGSAYDEASRIKVDSRGHAYVVGFTKSHDFPTSANAVQRSYGGGDSDAFLVELDEKGKLIYSTFLGGGEADQGDALSISGNGQVCLGGTTWSKDFPKANHRNLLHGMNADGFLGCFYPGQSDTLRTFVFGGSGDEKVTGIAQDKTRNLFVVGFTASDDFPIRAALQSALHGKQDAFVIRFDLMKWEIAYATYFGGSGADSAWGVAVDGRGNPVIAGTTHSADLPTTPGVFQSHLSGASNAFVVSLDRSGKKVRYSTYFGGSGDDGSGYDGDDVVVDSREHVWLAGMTNSRDLPVLNAYQPSYGGGELDGFVTEFSVGAKGLCYSTYYGGDGRDFLEGIAVTSDDDIYATGLTASRDLKPGMRTIQATYGGGFDAMVIGLGHLSACREN
jgi:Beta-propeller repeat